MKIAKVFIAVLVLVLIAGAVIWFQKPKTNVQTTTSSTCSAKISSSLCDRIKQRTDPTEQVQVWIGLTSNDKYALAAGFGQQDGQVSNIVEAKVYLNKIEELSKQPRVSYISEARGPFIQ